MTFDRFRLATVLRVVLLAGTVSLFAFFLFHTALYEMAALWGLLAAYQVFAMYRWIEKRNQNLTRFLEAVESDDFTQAFSVSKKSRAFDELNLTLNRITRRFEEVKAESESQFQYFQFVVQRLNVGLIVFQHDGKVEMINSAAKRLLGIPHLKNIEELGALSDELCEILGSRNPRSRNIVRIENDNISVRLSVQISEFSMRGTEYSLASLQDMRGELEEIELDAWQNLIRVLTHEIANSITPIASLASTANKLLSGPQLQSHHTGEPADPVLNDVRTAVSTIESRSEGLLRFVNSYRTLTHIPVPKLRIFPVSLLFARVEQLIKSSIGESGISLTSRVEPETLELTADPDLLEQVLLNLLANSAQALDKTPSGKIEMTAQLEERGKVIIRVADNGPGIPKDLQEKIFIPFFTTRETGSGIGLSLSRQILHMHHASISVYSHPGEKTVFTITF